jgi:hypothetical protein
MTSAAPFRCRGHRQNPRPEHLRLYAYLSGDVPLGRPTLRAYPPVRRHPGITLSPKLAIDGTSSTLRGRRMRRSVFNAGAHQNRLSAN